MDEWDQTVPDEVPAVKRADGEQQEAAVGLAGITEAFRLQLIACLEEAQQGRRGLFGEVVGEEESATWPEAVRLRELAMALQSVYAQDEERYALADEYLDLCTMHGEYHPGERKLARSFLERIERGEVGNPTEQTPW